MTRRVLLTMIAVAAVLAFTAGSLAASGEDVLAAGTYTAKIKALTCAGCGPLVRKTMEGMAEIQSATVDSKASSVEFVVKKDNSVKVADLQKALKAAADKMGMGADYTLSDVKLKK
jgi:hypothetical protein